MFNKKDFGKQEFKLMKDGNIKATRTTSIEEMNEYKDMFGRKKEFLNKQANALRENLLLAQEDIVKFKEVAIKNLSNAIKKHEEEVQWYEEHCFKINEILEEVENGKKKTDN